MQALLKQKVVHISRAKRLPYQDRAPVEPPHEMPVLRSFEVPEECRAIMVEADLRADLAIGDPGQHVLQKANYILRSAHSAFFDPDARELLVRATIEVIRDYGEPQGAILLFLALREHGHARGVRESVSLAAARFGSLDDLSLIVDAAEPDTECPNAHVHALDHFLDRFPEALQTVWIELLRRELTNTPLAEKFFERVSSEQWLVD